MPQLRPYQSEDVAAVISAHLKHRRVIGRAATGLGKAVELAALVAYYSKFGRVMLLVDVVKLVRQLAETIEWFAGIRPGIEMGDQRAANGGALHGADQVVISTVQTQYSGVEGYERYRQFDPAEFSCLLLDECELFLAPTARKVVDYYLDRNPTLKLFGCTATPFRTDGVAMANLFDHVAFDRDILWGIGDGYLVPARQAFVRVSLDFSTLRINRDEQGEADYSAEELAEKINNEQTLIELAKGIIHVCEDRKSIVVCPTVAVAKAVAHYLESERPGCARCVYGELGDEEKDDVMASHQRGEFQFLTSVMMLTKGYDDREIRAVVNCRKTKSERLYQQVLGRGTRPLANTVDGVATADARRAAIAASAKPDMLMVNMVGVDASVRDVTLVDILGASENSAVIERAKEIVEQEGKDTAEAVEQAEQEMLLEREAEKVRAEAEAADEERRVAEEFERRLRRSVQVDAEVHVEYRDDLAGVDQGDVAERIPSRQLGILRKAKFSEAEIAAMSAEEASRASQRCVARWKAGLCSHKQEKALHRFGYTPEETERMTFEQASAAFDELKEHGWRRPAAGSEAA